MGKGVYAGSASGTLSAMPSIESEREDVAKLRHMASEFTEGFNTGDVERIMRFVSVKRTPSCKRSCRTAMLRHDQTQKESVDEVAAADFRTGP